MAAPDLESVQDLRKWLQPTDYLSSGGEFAKHLNAYVVGTGDWLRQSEDFQRWRKDDEHGCLWIKGVPGSGKSVFAASTIQYLQRRDNDRELPVLYFFFRQIVERNHDPKYLVRDWATQLLPFSPYLQSALSDVSRHKHVDGNELTEVWDLLVAALHKMDEVYCVADALDEMDTESMGFIDKLKILGSDKGSPVKVLLTSRPIASIEQALRSSAVVASKLDPTAIYPDISKYAKSRLDSLQTIISPSRRILVEEALCQRSAGLFLYARLTMDSLHESLNNGTIQEDQLPAALADLPLDLPALYTRMLGEHAQRSGITQEEQLTIIQCVIQSSRPLRLIELGSMVAQLRQDYTVDGLRGGKQLVRDSCGRLLEILEDESISVIHHSFTEFVRTKGQTDKQGSFPILSEEAAQTLMVRVCLQYLNSCEPSPFIQNLRIGEQPMITEADEGLEEKSSVDDDEDNACDDLDYRMARIDFDKQKEVELKNLYQRYPLLDYCTKNLAYHIQNISRNQSELHGLLDEYFQPGLPAFSIWTCSQWHMYRFTGLQVLHIAAFRGWNSHIQHLIDTSCILENRDGEGCTPLLYAASAGLPETVSLLLTHGANPHVNERDGNSPLHLAVEKGNIESARLLLASGLSPISTKSNSTQEWIYEGFGSDADDTPLKYACENGNRELIKLFSDYIEKRDATKCFFWALSSKDDAILEWLLESKRVDLNAFHNDDTFDRKQSALGLAVQAVNLSQVKLLLRYGADATNCVGDQSGVTALHIFAGYHRWTRRWFPNDDTDPEECINLLIESGCDVNQAAPNGYIALHFACRGDPAGDDIGTGFATENMIVRLLLKYGANPNLKGDNGATPLHILDCRNTELLDVLVNAGAEINARSNTNNTPLLNVVRSLNEGFYRHESDVSAVEATIEKLLQYGADASLRNTDGNTIFHEMFRRLAKFQNSATWEMLLKAGASFESKNEKGNPPLLEMVVDRYLPIEKTILTSLTELGLDINCTNASGETVLSRLLAQYEPSLEVLKQFISLDCDAKVVDSKGNTLLHQCIMRSVSWEIFNLLVRSGASICAVNSEGDSLLHILALHQHPVFNAKLSYLLSAGISISSQNVMGRTALHVASTIVQGQFSMPKYPSLLHTLLSVLEEDLHALNLQDKYGATALHYASSTSEFYTRALLESGADATIKTKDNLSSLHVAARAIESNTLGVLLSHYLRLGVLTAMIDAQDEAGRTALHYACRSGHHQSVQYLLDYGAAIDVKDRNGRAPIHALAEIQEDQASRQGETEIETTNKTDMACCTLSSNLPLRNVHTIGPSRATEILDLLLDYGANSLARDSQGYTISELAMSESDSELYKALAKRDMIDTFGDTITPEEAISIASKARELFNRVEKQEIWQRKDEYFQSKAKVMRFKQILTASDIELFHQYQRFQDVTESGSDVLDYTGLHAVIDSGHYQLLQKYVSKVKHLERQNSQGLTKLPKTLLYHACTRDMPSLSAIQILVEDAGADVNQRSRIPYHDDPHFACPLHKLAEGLHFWQIAALKYLIERGADVEVRNSNGYTPLLSAVSSPHESWRIETMLLLLEHGADVNAISEAGISALNISDSADVTRLLLQKGADVNLGSVNALTSAVDNSNLESVVLLLEAGADCNTDTPLYRAGTRHRNKSVEDEVLKTRERIMSVLLENGADPYAIRSDGTTILQSLIEVYGITSPIISHENLNLEVKGADLRTPLISACFPKPSNEKPWYGSTPELNVCCEPKIALSLLERGARPEAQDAKGRTPLHWICSIQGELDQACQEVITKMLDLSPGLIDVQDNEGFTALQIALSGFLVHDWLLRFLVSRGANPCLPDPNGNTALHHIATRLVGEKNQANISAAQFQYLLALGCRVNHRNDLGETALFKFISTSWKGTRDPTHKIGHPTYAEENDVMHMQTFHLFVSAGADLYTMNKAGETLLHATAKRREMEEYGDWIFRKDAGEIFKELMARGVDHTIEEDHCKTAIDVAVANGHTFLVDLFGPKDMETQDVTLQAARSM